MQRIPKLALLMLVAGILVGVVATTQLGWLPNSHAERNSEEVTTPATETPPTYDRAFIRDLNGVFIELAENARPSVVTIFTDKVIRTRTSPYASPFFSDPFREFFGDDFFRFFGPPRQEPREEERHLRGMGSGVIVSDDGYILTNNHVVGDADKVQVMFFDGRKVEAEIVGTDPKTDIAVIKVKKDGLKPIAFGNSDELRVGEWVIAVGSPLSENLAHTVTAGIVSATGRANLNLADYEDFIQTDAAINPGNSGGALINLEGKLVGINTAIATRSGGFQGIGFAVPINMAKAVMDALIKHGKVVRGWLGIYIQDVDETMAKAMNLPQTGGALVSDVTKGSPAEKAGVKAGDVILKLDGQEVKNVTQLRNEIAQRHPGSKVTLTVYRDGKAKDITVELGELPEETPTPQARKDVFEKLGFSVEGLSQELARRFGYKPDERGVVVTEIRRTSAAFAAGLRVGDLIQEINRRPVNDLGDFNQVVSGLESGETVLLYAKRGSNKFFIAFKLD